MRPIERTPPTYGWYTIDVGLDIPAARGVASVTLVDDVVPENHCSKIVPRYERIQPHIFRLQEDLDRGR